MTATLRDLNDTKPREWEKNTIARILQTIPRNGSINGSQSRFLEALYTIK
jgi:hypothetical protein